MLGKLPPTACETANIPYDWLLQPNKIHLTWWLYKTRNKGVRSPQSGKKSLNLRRYFFARQVKSKTTVAAEMPKSYHILSSCWQVTRFYIKISWIEPCVYWIPQRRFEEELLRDPKVAARNIVVRRASVPTTLGALKEPLFEWVYTAIAELFEWVPTTAFVGTNLDPVFQAAETCWKVVSFYLKCSVPTRLPCHAFLQHVGMISSAS